VICGDVVDTDSEVILSFERNADLLMEEESGVEGAGVELSGEGAFVNSAGGVEELAVSRIEIGAE
jgi:hypothetical protein